MHLPNKMQRIKKPESEGIINALVFVCAIIVLARNEIGILSIPGIIVAIICIYCILAGKYSYSSLLGAVTTAGSITAQSMTAYCSSCSLAATIFAIGALISLLLIIDKKVSVVALVLLLCLGSAVAMSFMLANDVPYASPAIKTQVAEAVNKTEITTDKALLYIMPDCKGCKSKLESFIAIDPDGTEWQPVVFPQLMAPRGEALLREKGYRGSILTSASCPTPYVPVMQVGDKLFRGDQINFNNIRKIGKENV